MNIIFGDAVEQLPDNLVILELDTFVIKPTDQKVTTWCVVESLPPAELIDLNENKKLHNELMVNYRSRQWDMCLENIASLEGHWGGEVDTFYQEIKKRVSEYKKTPPTSDWDGTVIKNTKTS